MKKPVTNRRAEQSPAWPFYGEPFIVDTCDLSMTEAGAYALMIVHCMTHRQPLPADPKRICRMLGAQNKRERDAVIKVLADHWDRDPIDGSMHNRKCDALLAGYEHPSDLVEPDDVEDLRQPVRAPRPEPAQVAQPVTVKSLATALANRFKLHRHVGSLQPLIAPLMPQIDGLDRAQAVNAVATLIGLHVGWQPVAATPAVAPRRRYKSSRVTPVESGPNESGTGEHAGQKTGQESAAQGPGTGPEPEPGTGEDSTGNRAGSPPVPEQKTGRVPDENRAGSPPVSIPVPTKTGVDGTTKPGRFSTGSGAGSPPVFTGSTPVLPGFPDQKPDAGRSKRASKPAQFVDRFALIESGASAQHVDDWLAQRKKRPTRTAITQMEAEARKLNITLAQAIQICAEREWEGLRASWPQAQEAARAFKSVSAQAGKWWQGSGFTDEHSAKAAGLTPANVHEWIASIR